MSDVTDDPPVGCRAVLEAEDTSGEEGRIGLRNEDRLEEIEEKSLRRAGMRKKARLRTRGPYRKALAEI